MPKLIRFAFDGNEANVAQRVGSNVYAFEVLKQLHNAMSNPQQFDCTVLLAHPPVDGLPASRSNWRYRVVTPARLWTQWALPLHLAWYQGAYDLFFTPGHYAPRFSPVPYISSVMDLAFLDYPQQYRKKDVYQLTSWTRSSVAHARKIITISEFSKRRIHEKYGTPLSRIVVAPPAVSLPAAASPLRSKAFLRKHGIAEKNYLLYVGTLQPRKNLVQLIDAFEIFSRFYAANQLKKRVSRTTQTPPAPQLVLAGKVGWLADSVLKRIEASPLKEQIITTGFISDDIKRTLYGEARATILIGSEEGFGIPPLESLSVGTIPIVSNDSSLPEVVGTAGMLVDPADPAQTADALKRAWNMSTSERARFLKRAAKQTAQFSWKKTGRIILRTLIQEARHAR